MLEKVPAPHGSGADEPGAQWLPATHCLHVVCPVAFWYAPAGQLLQIFAAGAALKVPGAQAVNSVLPAPHALPARHGWHRAAAASLVASEKEPAGQGSATLEL